MRTKRASSPFAPGRFQFSQVALAVLFSLFLIPNIIFYCFEGLLGRSAVLVLALFAAGVLAAFVFKSATKMESGEGLSTTVIATCFAAALVLCLLGGEGRIFYANPDWQVRDPLYHDIVANLWPFKYAIGSLDQFFVLRAPVGIYLLPAVFAKLLGSRYEDLTFLLQNTIILGILFALVASLFNKSKQFYALIIFIFFGGMEIVGYSIQAAMSGHGFHPDHIENWSSYFQYSSTITLVFWTPHHCFPGIAAGVLYAMWSRKRIPVAVLLASGPLIALWSPFASVGILPFALHATIVSLKSGERLSTVFPGPLVTGAVCLLPIGYLLSGTNGMGWRLGLMPIMSSSSHAAQMAGAIYVLFVALQVLPFLLILFWKGRYRITIAGICLMSALLLVFPFIHVGEGIDFCMRASIPAIAIMAIETIETLFSLGENKKSYSDRFAFVGLLVILCLGSVTGLLEVRRAITHTPVEATGCNFVDGWNASGFWKLSYETYLADEKAMPAVFQLGKASVIRTGLAHSCWSGDWYEPR